MADLRRNKALAELLETAVVTDESGNPVDLKALAEQQGGLDALAGGDLDEEFDAEDGIGEGLDEDE
jgi:trigger factor